jgi:hypothetical protein
MHVINIFRKLYSIQTMTQCLISYVIKYVHFSMLSLDAASIFILHTFCIIFKHSEIQ